MDEGGALPINGVAFDTVKDVWQYLTRGLHPELKTFDAYCEWRRVCDFLVLNPPDPLADCVAGGSRLSTAFATSQWLMVKGQCSGGLSPFCYPMDFGGACQPQKVEYSTEDVRALEASLGFDHISLEGSLRLQAPHSAIPLEVQLDPGDGSLQVRFMQEGFWQNVGKYHTLKDKRIVALKVRKPSSCEAPWTEARPGQLELAELYLHVVPAGKRRKKKEPCKDVCMATWPSFWCLVHIIRRKAQRCEAWSSWNATVEVLPGAVYLMKDDLVVQVVMPPRSPKSYLRVCGADLENEVLVRLVAPTPCSRPRKGKGRGVSLSAHGKGAPPRAGPSLFSGQRKYQSAIPSHSTPTQEEVRSQPSRHMQQIWIVRRRSTSQPPHLVVLLHSADGRVAAAQLSGQSGSIPPLYGGLRGRKTCAIWGARAEHWGENCMFGAMGQYRGSYDVPKCHKILAVALLEDQSISVLHKPSERSTPQLWTIRQPSSHGGAATFFRMQRKSKGGKGGVGKGGGSWHEDYWGTSAERLVLLPDELVDKEWSLFLPLWPEKGTLPPEVEVLCLEGSADLPGGSAGPVHAQCQETSQGASWSITRKLHYSCREPSVNQEAP